jgi:hypothetical protein
MRFSLESPKEAPGGGLSSSLQNSSDANSADVRLLIGFSACREDVYDFQGFRIDLFNRNAFFDALTFAKDSVLTALEAPIISFILAIVATFRLARIDDERRNQTTG